MKTDAALRLRMGFVDPVTVVVFITELAKAAKSISDLLGPKVDQRAEFEKLEAQLTLIQKELDVLGGKLDAVIAALAEIKVMLRELPNRTFVLVLSGFIADINQYYSTWANNYTPQKSPAVPLPKEVYKNLHDAVNALRITNSFAHYPAVALGMVYERAMLHLPSLRADLESVATQNIFDDYLNYFKRAADASPNAMEGSIGVQLLTLVSQKESLEKNINDRGRPLYRDTGVLYGYHLKSEGPVPPGGLHSGEVIQIIEGDLQTGFRFSGEVRFMPYTIGTMRGISLITEAELLAPGSVRIDAWEADLNAMHSSYLTTLGGIETSSKALENIADLVHQSAIWAHKPAA